MISSFPNNQSMSSIFTNNQLMLAISPKDQSAIRKHHYSLQPINGHHCSNASIHTITHNDQSSIILHYFITSHHSVLFQKHLQITIVSNDQSQSTTGSSDQILMTKSQPIITIVFKNPHNDQLLLLIVSEQLITDQHWSQQPIIILYCYTTVPNDQPLILLFPINRGVK